MFEQHDNYVDGDPRSFEKGWDMALISLHDDPLVLDPRVCTIELPLKKRYKPNKPHKNKFYKARPGDDCKVMGWGIHSKYNDARPGQAISHWLFLFQIID